jgi:cytosine/adenosine deaminase-related metal-dependent hydrolase
MDTADARSSSSTGCGGLAQPRVEHEARLGNRGRRVWRWTGLLWGLGTGRPRRLQQRPLDVRGDGLRGQAREGLDERPDGFSPRARLVAAATPGARGRSGWEKTGSLEAGKRADIVAVETRTAHEEPFEDVYSTLVYSAKTSDVTDVWVDGKRLLANKRCTTLDEKAVLDAAVRWRKKVRETLAAPKEPAKP